MDKVYLMHANMEGFLIDYAFDSLEKMDRYLQIVNDSGRGGFNYRIEERIVDEQGVVR